MQDHRKSCRSASALKNAKHVSEHSAKLPEAMPVPRFRRLLAGDVITSVASAQKFARTHTNKALMLSSVGLHRVTAYSSFF
jgi:hypothetical protein